MNGRMRWACWLSLLALWTFALLVPPWLLPRAAFTELPGGIGLGKVAHVVVYAVLSGSIRLLPIPKGRWRMIVLLSVHAISTEILQTMTGRTGRLFDVGLDHVGIGIGAVITAMAARR